MTSETTGYGHKGRQPAGRSIIESRDSGYKLTIWAQDLRSETFYNTYLLFADGARYAGISMGLLPVDEKGKGELRRDFDAEVISGFQLQDIMAVVVLVKGTAGVVSPLCGYKDRPVSWRHGFYEYERRVAENMHVDTPVVELPPEQPATPDILPATEESAAPLVEIALPSDGEHPQDPAQSVETPGQVPEEIDTCLPHEDSPEEIATHQPESGALEEIVLAQPEEDSKDNVIPRQYPAHNQYPTLPPGEISKSFRTALDQLRAETMANMTPNTSDPMDSAHQAYSKNTNALDAMFETKEPITPFQRQARKTTWVSFTPTDPVPPPTNKPHIFQDPFVQAALTEYKHLILGVTTDGRPRRYIIGVPGTNNNESRQKARQLGFTQFKPCDETQPSWGTLGYWLMFVTV